MHMFLLRREQGRLAETESGTRSAVDQCPWYPVHRAALGRTLHELGRETEARAIFDDLATDDFAALYRDSEWLLGIALTSETCAILEDAVRASVLYEQILPFERRPAAVVGEGGLGAMDRYLGLLAATTGRLDDAERHFHVAIEMNERMGARPWTAHSRVDLAEVLLARDGPGDHERAIEELTAARVVAERLGMIALATKVDRRLQEIGSGIPTAPTAVATTGRHVFRREGEYWTLVFDQDAFRLRDAKGMQYLAKLLAEPGREFHALDLVGGISVASPRPTEGNVRSRGEALGHAGEILDPQAKAAYRRRLGEIEEDLSEAEALGDADRAERARTEREFLTAELAAAVGLGGRDRLAASASERARVNVTRAIKSALGRIQQHSPSLGRHLSTTIRTGTFCSYEPDPRLPVTWQH
jgi:hypothetical protein